MMDIGVVGYSEAKFDENIAKALMAIALDIVETNHPSKEYTLVSGLTDLGIPAIAYEMADKRGWKTMGIACEKAKDYECYDVDKELIVGKEWGDESATFLRKIDVLVRIGGGKQSMREVEVAKKSKAVKAVYEFDLPENK